MTDQVEGPSYKDYSWGLETTIFHRIGLRIAGTHETVAEWDDEARVLRFRPANIPIASLDDLAYVIKGLQDLYAMINRLAGMRPVAVATVVSTENEQRRQAWIKKRDRKLEEEAKERAAASRPAKKKAKAKQVRKKSGKRKKAKAR